MNIQELLSQADRVFPAQPLTDRYFPSSSGEQARDRLARAIARGDGPGLLIGATGTGKTLMLSALAAQFRQQFDVVFLQCAQLCTRRALLQAILFELGLPYRYHDEGELRLTLLNHLLPNKRCQNGVLLLVDEAQSLPTRLLEELRLLTNLVRDGQPRARLVIAGSPILDELFAAPELESLQQRISARCYLAPLDYSETEQYVRAHLASCSATATGLFEQEAISAVFDATDGVPRLINQLCDAALNSAANGGLAEVSKETVQEAWSELQQLPTPWVVEPPALATREDATEVVEFGALAETDAVEECAATTEEFHVVQPEDTDRDSFDSNYYESQVLDLDPGDSDGEPQRVALDLIEPDSANITFGTDVESEIACSANTPQEQQSSVDTPFELATENAADPFQEEFDDEVEIESTSVLGDTLGASAPRVVNQVDNQLSCMVLDAARGKTTDDLETQVFDTDVENRADVLPIDIESLPKDFDSELEAQVLDTLESVPLLSLAIDDLPGRPEDYDPVFPDYSAVSCEDIEVWEEGVETGPTLALTTPVGDEEESGDAASVLSIVPPSATVQSDDEEAVLIVEDQPITEAEQEESAVHRMEYDQLFAKLRRN